MTFIKELEATMLTVRFDVLTKKSQEILEKIGDLPILFFPEWRKELIEMAEEEKELAERLRDIYVSENESIRIEYIGESIRLIDEQLYLLKRG